MQIERRTRGFAARYYGRLAESSNRASFLPSLDEAGAALKSAPEPESSSEPLNSSALEEAVKVLNRALAQGDATAIMNQLGIIARERGMSHVARQTGLARESLYRSLDAKGNPEFGTVLKVLASIGLRLEAKSESLPTAPDQDQSSLGMAERGKPKIA